jgi:alkanesulfonate monooxygenase SsuD/methylene tetrahydromethanopterin reductase-like flavin-dependent oxidoreductase (luciferase family)
MRAGLIDEYTIVTHQASSSMSCSSAVCAGCSLITYIFQMLDERPTVPTVGLRSEQPLKLGIFCLNVSSGTTMTAAASGDLSWELNAQMARVADEAGWDFLLPLGRWRGLGGRTDPNKDQFESFTWAAGLAALTRRISVCATCHVPLLHPIVVAKQGATIDHIGGGRFAMNVVAGWSEAEFSMFGIEQLSHDVRYDAAEEWLTCIERLWSENGRVDFAGSYYEIEDGYLSPKPLAEPVIISAGSSPRGVRFAMQRADFAFVPGHDLDDLELSVRRVEQTKEEIGGKARILSHGPVVVADTEAEAKRYFEWYVDELGDYPAARGLAEQLIGGGVHNLPSGGRVDQQERPAVPDAVYDRLARGLMAGWGGLPLVGTPEQVADALVRVHGMGVAGMALSWVDYAEGFARFEEQVAPLLREAGVRV